MTAVPPKVGVPRELTEASRTEILPSAFDVLGTAQPVQKLTQASQGGLQSSGFDGLSSAGTLQKLTEQLQSTNVPAALAGKPGLRAPPKLAVANPPSKSRKKVCMSAISVILVIVVGICVTLIVLRRQIRKNTATPLETSETSSTRKRITVVEAAEALIDAFFGKARYDAKIYGGFDPLSFNPATFKGVTLGKIKLHNLKTLKRLQGCTLMKVEEGKVLVNTEVGADQIPVKGHLYHEGLEGEFEAVIAKIRLNFTVRGSPKRKFPWILHGYDVSEMSTLKFTLIQDWEGPEPEISVLEANEMAEGFMEEFHLLFKEHMDVPLNSAFDEFAKEFRLRG